MRVRWQVSEALCYADSTQSFAARQMGHCSCNSKGLQGTWVFDCTRCEEDCCFCCRLNVGKEVNHPSIQNHWQARQTSLIIQLHLQF